MEESLLKQRDNLRFRHAIDYVRNSSIGIKKINSGELARLNQMLTGSQEDPWRKESVQLHLPSGRVRDFSVISNPVVQTREIIFRGYDLMKEGEHLEAATYVYAHLVMGHFFEDANRRTAILAILWLLSEHGKPLDAEALSNDKVGDLGDKNEVEKLKVNLAKQIRSAE